MTLTIAYRKHVGFKSWLMLWPVHNVLYFEYKVLLCMCLLHQVCTTKPYDASDRRISAKGNAGYLGMLQPCPSPCTSKFVCTSPNNSGSSGSATCEGKHPIIINFFVSWDNFICDKLTKQCAFVQIMKFAVKKKWGLRKTVNSYWLHSVCL